MAIVSPLLMCMSLAVCSAPIIRPDAGQSNDISGKDISQIPTERNTIVLVMSSTLLISEQKPINEIMNFQINREIERPLISKPEPLPAFSTEIELTPSWWPLRGTFNPLGMKLKLHMPL